MKTLPLKDAARLSSFAQIPIFKMRVNPSTEEIKAMILQLPFEKQVALMEDIQKKIETVTMMQLTETGFQEWDDLEEDIYNDETYHKLRGKSQS